VGGARHHQLALAGDVVKREVAAEAHDMAAVGVGDDEALVRQPASQRRDVDGAVPARQGMDAVEHGHGANARTVPLPPTGEGR